MKPLGPSLALSLLLAVSGVVIGIYGLVGAMAAWDHPEVEAPIGKMVVMFVGASMFAVGGLMLLVVMARPLFEKRDVDHIVDEIKDELTDQRPRL